MNSQPLVTVIIPCYNADLYVETAVRSIMQQTYLNLEIILINDCSVDGTKSILLELAKEDDRVVYIENDSNLKLIDTLNKGIRIAKGDYIARMDADDTARKDRLQCQVDFLEKNLEYAMCGTGIREFYVNNMTHKRFLPVSSELIKAEALFNSPFAHPTVMIRRSIFENHLLKYSREYLHAEDYELWTRILSVYKTANIPQILLDYRVSGKSVTSDAMANQDERFRIISLIQQKELLKIGIISSQKDVRLHYILCLSEYIRTIDFEEFSLAYIKTYCLKLKQSYLNHEYISKYALKRITGKVYLKVLLLNRKRIPPLTLLGKALNPLFIFGILDTILLRLSYLFNRRF